MISSDYLYCKNSYMKYVISIIFIISCSKGFAQKHYLEKIWETDTIIAIPESVLEDLNKNILFISLIDGGPWEMDGKGGIGKLSLNGENYDSTWITGLNAPKGMGIIGNKLYVADINNVTVIDIKNSKVIKKITIDSASGLNDIAINEKGIVFVSDSKTSRIWKIENEKPQLYLTDMKGVNGLKCIKEDLFIGAGKSFVKANSQKKITQIAEIPESIDGIEPAGNGDFILTAWEGYIYYLYADGSIETLLDTHLKKKNTADIAYDLVKKILYVPTFFAKSVTAYKLN